MTVVATGRRERKKQAVRDSILEETVGLLASRGVDGTTIEAICESADIARKTFYNYYPSKHELLIDICQSVLLARMERGISDALGNCEDLAGCIDYVFDAIAERNRQAGALERQLIEFLVSNLAANPEEGAGQLTLMNAYYQRLFESFPDELRDGLTPEFCAELSVGMSNAVALNWLHQENYNAGDRYRQVADFLKQSMLRPGAAGASC